MVTQVLKVIVVMLVTMVLMDVMGKIKRFKNAIVHRFLFSYDGAPGATGARVSFIDSKICACFLNRIDVLCRVHQVKLVDKVAKVFQVQKVNTIFIERKCL